MKNIFFYLLSAFVIISVFNSFTTKSVYAQSADPNSCTKYGEIPFENGGNCWRCDFTVTEERPGCVPNPIGTINCIDDHLNTMSGYPNPGQRKNPGTDLQCYYNDAYEAYCPPATVPATGRSATDATDQYTWEPFCGKQVPQSSINQLKIDDMYAKRILVTNGVCDNNSSALSTLKPSLVAQSTGATVRGTSTSSDMTWQVDATDDFTMTAPPLNGYTLSYGSSATCGSATTNGTSLTVHGSRTGGGGTDVYWYYRDSSSPTPTPVDPAPKGSHDPPSGGAACTIQGWACDASSYNTALQVDVYVDGVGYSLGANGQREQGVANACGNNPYHGFALGLPDQWRDGRSHTVRAYALGVDASGTGNGNNPELPVTRTITCNPPPTGTPVPTEVPIPPPAAPSLSCGTYNESTNTIPVIVGWTPTNARRFVQVYTVPGEQGTWYFNDWADEPKSADSVPNHQGVYVHISSDGSAWSPESYIRCDYTPPPTPTNVPGTWRITGRTYVFNASNPPDANSCPATGNLQNGVSVHLRRSDIDQAGSPQTTYSYQGLNGAFIFSGLTQQNYEVCVDGYAPLNAAPYCATNAETGRSTYCFKRSCLDNTRSDLSDCNSTGNIFLLRGPNPTPTPPICPTQSPPSNLLPSGTINPGSYPITWTAVSGATKYALRINDQTISSSFDWHRDPVDGHCIGDNGDYCNDNTQSGNYYNFIAGHQYNMWVHAINSCGNWSASTSSDVTVNDYDPIGYHDGASCSSFWGWSCDARYSQPLQVDFYDGPAAAGNYIGSTTANQDAENLRGVCGGTINHQFSVNPDTLSNISRIKDGQNHNIYAYSIGIDSSGQRNGHNPNLPSFHTISCQPPAPIITTPKCINPNYDGSGITISWGNVSPPRQSIDITDQAAFPAYPDYYNKGLSGTTTNGAGLKYFRNNAPLTYNPDTTYRVRTWGSNVFSQEASFSIPACPDPAPKGTHDSASCTNFSGWTCDESLYSQPLRVDFYDGPAAGNNFIGNTTANITREQAVADACGGYPNHGFNVNPDTLPNVARIKDGQNHAIYAYSIGINRSGQLNDVNPVLPNSPLQINCPPPPTPTQGPWIKLSNASYVGQHALSDQIPTPGTALPYDGSDDGSSFFVGGAGAGLVSAASIDIPPPLISQHHWTALYNYAPAVAKDDFYSYVRSKKQYTKIADLGAIDRDGVYVWDGASFPTLTSVPAAFNSYNVVLIVDGTVTINTPVFAPQKSTALLANSIAFSPGTNEAHGIFIASTVTTGSTPNGGLKIVGNLIHQSGATPFVNERAWADNHKPSLFVIFDPALYLDLLPYLSTSFYQWGETPVATGATGTP